MFSFSGHILTNKRRKTIPYLFGNLVFLKLNEDFYKLKIVSNLYEIRLIFEFYY